MAIFEQLSAKMVADLVRDYKLQAFQAAAFPGNAGEESGGFTKLQEVNPTSGRGGLGFFQDTGPRRVAFEAWLARNADKNWSAGDYAANYSFLVRELDGEERQVLAPLRSASTVEEATEIVMRVFERPAAATARLDVRTDYARKALAAFQATGQDEAELRAQGRPGAAQGPIQLPPAPQIGQILPPLSKLDPNTIAPLIQAALPIILPLIQQLIAQRQQGATGAQQPQGIDLAGILGQLLPGLAPQPATPPTPPPQPVNVTVATPPAAPKTSVGLGLLGLFGSAIGMATGHVGTPFGMGADPTTAGTLSILIPAAISAVGATGILGPWGAIIGNVVGAVGTAIANKPKS